MLKLSAMEDLHATITVSEAAKMLGVSVQRVHRMIANETLTVAHRLPGVTGAKLLDRATVEAHAGGVS